MSSRCTLVAVESHIWQLPVPIYAWELMPPESRAEIMPWSGLKEIYPTQHLNDSGAVNLKGTCHDRETFR